MHTLLLMLLTSGSGPRIRLQAHDACLTRVSSQVLFQGLAEQKSHIRKQGRTTEPSKDLSQAPLCQRQKHSRRAASSPPQPGLPAARVTKKHKSIQPHLHLRAPNLQATKVSLTKPMVPQILPQAM